MHMPELNFRNVRLIVYTLFTWLSLVAAASAQNALHKAESSVGAKRDRLVKEGHIVYPNAQSVVVHLQVDDLHGIAAAVMFCAGFLGIVYVILQNALILEHKKNKYVRWTVRFVDSPLGHLILLISGVILWCGTILTTGLAFWIAYNREQNVKMYIDGVKLSQVTVNAIERLNKMPTRYWGHGYVRFMCIAPWPQVALTIFPFALHVMAYRRLCRARTVVSSLEGGIVEDGVAETSSIEKASISEERIETREENVRASL